MTAVSVVFLLALLNVLLAIHMFFSHRANLEQMALDRLLYEAKREEVELIRAQSAAIGWLTERAKSDITAEANQTRAKVEATGEEIKKEMRTVKNGGPHP